MDDPPRSPGFRSQGFSPSQRFASRLELTGLFHPAAARATSFRAFPSQGSRTPLEAASSPTVPHQDPGRDSQRLITRGFPDSHARARSPGSPTDYGLPFHMARKPHFPFALGAERRGRPLTQLSPSRSLVPPESPFTPARVAPRRRPLLSWSSALLEPVPLNLGVSTRPSLTAGARPSPRRVGAAASEDPRGAEAPRRPPAPREASRRQAPLRPLRRIPARCGLGLAASRRRTCSCDLLPTA